MTFHIFLPVVKFACCELWQKSRYFRQETYILVGLVHCFRFVEFCISIRRYNINQYNDSMYIYNIMDSIYIVLCVT